MITRHTTPSTLDAEEAFWSSSDGITKERERVRSKLTKLPIFTLAEEECLAWIASTLLRYPESWQTYALLFRQRVSEPLLTESFDCAYGVCICILHCDSSPQCKSYSFLALYLFTFPEHNLLHKRIDRNETQFLLTYILSFVKFFLFFTWKHANLGSESSFPPIHCIIRAF